MSTLTKFGRQSLRDQNRNYLARRLEQHEWFERVPKQVVSGLAELLLTSKELRARIKAEGVMRERADGTTEVNPAVEQLRRFKATELDYIRAIFEMRGNQESEVDLTPADCDAIIAASDKQVEPERAEMPESKG